MRTIFLISGAVLWGAIMLIGVAGRHAGHCLYVVEDGKLWLPCEAMGSSLPSPVVVETGNTEAEDPGWGGLQEIACGRALA